MGLGRLGEEADQACGDRGCGGEGVNSVRAKHMRDITYIYITVCVCYCGRTMCAEAV